MPTSDGTVWMKIQGYPSLSHNCLLRHYHHIRCRLSTVGHRPLTLTIFASAGSGLHPSQTPGLNQVIRPLFWWTSNAALTDPRSPFENFSTLTAIYSLCSTACSLPLLRRPYSLGYVGIGVGALIGLMLGTTHQWQRVHRRLVGMDLPACLGCIK